MNRRNVVLLAVVAGAIASGIMLYGVGMREDLAIPASLSRVEFEAVRTELTRLGRKNADRETVLLELGERFANRSKWEAAGDCFSSIASTHQRLGASARYLEGQVRLQQERFGAAETNFRDCLRQEEAHSTLDPSIQIQARRYLAGLLGSQLRFEERDKLLAELVERQVADPFETLAYCFPASMSWNSAEEALRIERALKNEPKNRSLKLALARYRIGEGRIEDAEAILSDCVKETADDLRVAVVEAEILNAAGNFDAVRQRIDRLPLSDENEPWLLLRLRGSVLLRTNQPELAAERFKRLLSQKPHDVEALQGLMAAARMLHNEELIRKTQSQVAALARIQTRIAWAINDPNDSKPLIEILNLCDSAGLTEGSREIRLLGKRQFPNAKEFDADLIESR